MSLHSALRALPNYLSSLPILRFSITGTFVSPPGNWCELNYWHSRFDLGTIEPNRSWYSPAVMKTDQGVLLCHIANWRGVNLALPKQKATNVRVASQIPKVQGQGKLPIILGVNESLVRIGFCGVSSASR